MLFRRLLNPGTILLLALVAVTGFMCIRSLRGVRYDLTFRDYEDPAFGLVLLDGTLAGYFQSEKSLNLHPDSTGDYIYGFGSVWLYRDSDHHNTREWGFEFPFWLVPLVLAAIALVMALRTRKRAPSGGCVACGYNLTGNLSGICPECGSKIPEGPGMQRSRASLLIKLLGAIGILFCLAILGGGFTATWYGTDGIRYALTSAPRGDRNGDLFGASLLCVIGVVTSTFSIRWSCKLYQFIGRSR